MDIGRWCDGHGPSGKGSHGPKETKAFRILLPRGTEGIRMLCPECFWKPQWQEAVEKLAQKNNLETVRQQWACFKPVTVSS